MCLSTLRGSKGEGRTVPPRYLKVTHWNIEGIFSDVHGNKLDDPDFLNATKNNDLIESIYLKRILDLQGPSST